MAQKLILPINKTRITAGYKNGNYKNQFGFNHYGSDSTSTNSDRTVWGSGVGKVVETGFDNVLGNVVVIRYDNCQLKNGSIRSLIQRLYHLNRIDVTKGQSITKDTRIGLYGSTGSYATGPHLHIEFDIDVNYPTYSPTLGSSSNIIKAGTDSTLNPTDVLHVKNTAPDYQSVVGASNSNCWLKSDVNYSRCDELSPDGSIGVLYYPTPNYSGTSLVGALNTIGVDSSFDNREKIAVANGITNYTGTATQNNSLFSLLMSGQLKRPGAIGGVTSYFPTPNYSGTSLVGALNAIGVDSSFDNREKIAGANGITNYTGTANQNNTLFNLLMSGQLKCPTTDGDSDLDGGGTGTSYYPTPNYSGTSLVGALNAIGVDSSFDNREKIAGANGITNYTGTANQNDKLFNLLMSGRLKRPGCINSEATNTSYYPTPGYNGTSLVGALDAIGVDTSFDNREKIAAANGITNYTGTAGQNNKLFNLLMSGQLKRPGFTSEDDNGSSDTGEGLTEIGYVPNLKVRKILPSTNKYDIKCPYPMDPTYITVHNTANQASAINEIKYMHSNNNEVSFHYAVDDIEAIQGLPLNRNGWHSGDGSQGTGNRKSIAVEICYSKYGGDKFDESERNAAKLIAALMDKFSIPIDRVRKHQDWSGKYCPHRTLDAGWNRFVDMIMKEVRKRKILKFASENGLLKGFDIELQEYNKKEKLLEVPGMFISKPHIIVYGEVTIAPTITGILDPTTYINLSETPEKMADTAMELASKSSLNIDVSKEGLALTLSQVDMGKFNCDTLKLIVKVQNGSLNLIVEAEETKEVEHLTTTFYQKITITIHPDINSLGLVHVPIADPTVNPNVQEEFVDFLRLTNTLVGYLGLIVITGTCILTPVDEVAVGIAVIKAFSLLIQKKNN